MTIDEAEFKRLIEAEFKRLHVKMNDFSKRLELLEYKMFGEFLKKIDELYKQMKKYDK